MADLDAAWNKVPPQPPLSRWRRFGAALPMRASLIAVGVVWLLGCVWSYQEQSAFAASKGFTFPHLLPLVIDGFAVSMAGVSWAASLDARPAIPARLATVVAVGASSASNGVWAYLRTQHDLVTVVLGVAVPVAANLAFEVLLAELRRQVQRRRGLPPPVAVPYPRLIRLFLAPWQTFRAWRKLVLELTAMEHTISNPDSALSGEPRREPVREPVRAVAEVSEAPVPDNSPTTAPSQVEPARYAALGPSNEPASAADGYPGAPAPHDAPTKTYRDRPVAARLAEVGSATTRYAGPRVNNHEHRPAAGPPVAVPAAQHLASTYPTAQEHGSQTLDHQQFEHSDHQYSSSRYPITEPSAQQRPSAPAPSTRQAAVHQPTSPYPSSRYPTAQGPTHQAPPPQGPPTQHQSTPEPAPTWSAPAEPYRSDRESGRRPDPSTPPASATQAATSPTPSAHARPAVDDTEEAGPPETDTGRAGDYGRAAKRPVDPRVERLAQHLATAEDADELTGEGVSELLGINVAPRTGRRLLGQARDLVSERTRAAQDQDAELSVIGGR